MTDLSLPGPGTGHTTLLPDPADPGLASPPPGLEPAETSETAAPGVTGRRVAAALIDIAVLLGLFVILSQIVGRTSAGMSGGTRFSIDLLTITRAGHAPVDIGLYGAWTLLYGAVTLAYYFALEAWTGQTVGKSLLGLRVARSNGGRAGPGAVAARTLLRAIDGLPALYLVGFVSVLATGGRRARLGDLAAGTAVVRTERKRRRLAAVALIAVAAAAVELPVYHLASPGGPQAFQAHGVSFTYPPGWREVPASDLRARGHIPAARWRAGLALDEHNLIVLSAQPQGHLVTPANIAALTPSFGQALRRSQASGRAALLAGPEPITLGGLPAEQAWFSTLTPSGAHVTALHVFAFRGTTEYNLTCQHTQGRAGQVTKACGQIMRTFRVAGVPSSETAGPFATPSRRFGTGAAAVCERAGGRIPPAPSRHATGRQVAAAFSRLARFIDHTVAGFAGVGVPAAWQYPFGEFLAHLGQFRDGVANLAGAIRADDPRSARKQWHAALAASARLRHDNRWLTGHGLATCTWLGHLTG